MDRGALFAHVRDTYGSEPEYLWARLPGCAVLRHESNRKWYAVVMDVSAEKLGLPGADKVDILNVKVDPEDALVLRLADNIMPAYHMNKKNWVSIILGSSISDELVEELVAKSYALTK